MNLSGRPMLAAVASVTVAGCNNQEDVPIFETVERRAQRPGFTEGYCAINMEKARAVHVRVAPKYTSMADCESDFGAERRELAPQRTTSGGSVFMSLRMDHMLGGSRCVATQPLYRSGNDADAFRIGDNRKVASKTGISRVVGTAAQAAARTRTIRRDGFRGFAG